MSFERDQLREITTRVFDDIESEMDGVNARQPFSVERAVGVSVAGASHGLRGRISELERNLMPDTAAGSYLLRRAAEVGVTQLQPSLAHITYEFSGVATTSIPAGTTVSVGGVDFTTDAIAAVGGGGTVEVEMTAVLVGTTGNVEAGTSGSLASPITDVDAAGEVVSLDVEARDLESEDDLRDRYLERLRNVPKGGGPGDYERWAEETPTVAVAKAWQYDKFLGGGTVGVIFAKASAGDDTGLEVIPTSGEVATVLAYLQTKAPTTSYMYCFAPIAQPLNPIINLPAGTSDAVKDAIVASLNDLLDPENGNAPGSVVNGTSTTVLVSRIREAISQADGEVDHELVYPTADVESEFGHLVVLGTLPIQFGVMA